MEEQNFSETEQELPEEEQDLSQESGKQEYKPRPAWQILGAWIGVIIVAVAFLLYCWQIAAA